MADEVPPFLRAQNAGSPPPFLKAQGADEVPPFLRPKAAAVSGKGGGIEREAGTLDPGLTVSGRARTPARNAQIGGAPGSGHLEDNARDFTPRKGETLDSLYARLNRGFGPKGYQVLEERAGDPHSTGPHVHVGWRPGAQDFQSGQPGPLIAPQQKPTAPAKPSKLYGGLYGATSLSAPGPRSLLQRLQDEYELSRKGTGLTGALANAAMGGMGQNKEAIKRDELEREALAARREKYDPAWRPGLSNLKGNLAREAAKMGGHAAGELNPLYLIGGGGGLLARMGTQAAVQGGTNLLEQGLRAKQRLQRGVDPWAVAESAAGGAGFEGAGALVKPLAKLGAKGVSAALETSAGKPIAQAAKDLYTGARSVANPLAASPAARSVGMFIRKARGTSQLEADQAAHAFQKVGEYVERGGPEEQAAWLQFVEGRSKGMPERATQGVPVKGEEGKAAADIAAVHTKELAEKLGLNAKDVKAADTFAQVFQNYRDRATEVIKNNVGSAPRFMEDYFPHMWENSEKEVANKYADWLAKQGSGRNLKARTIPTIQEGIEMGLKPKYGIVQTAQIYAENMSRFLETHETLGWMKTENHAQWHRPGQQPEGWVPLAGAFTERQPKMRGGGRGGKFESYAPGSPLRLEGPGQPQLGGPEAQRALPPGEPPILNQGAIPGGGLGPVRPGSAGLGHSGGPSLIEDAAAGARNITPGIEKPGAARSANVADRGVNKEVLYAPPEVARLYNNHISKPFAPGKTPGETVAHYAHKAAVADMLWKFAFSAYHASTVSIESVISSVASGLQSASRGQIGRSLKEIGTAPIAPVLRFSRGAKMKKDLLGGVASSPFDAKLNEQFARAGGKLHMDRDYRATAAKSFYSALKEGNLRRELQLTAQKFKGAEGLKAKAKEAARAVANGVQSISGPLFEDLIPKMKMGAWAQNMQSFMEKFPNASQQELDAYAARALDSIDNRYGEMIKDNLFWNKKTEQLSNIALLAPTWKFGSLREFLGGLHDIPESTKGLVTGKGISPRTAHVAASAAVLATIGGIATYLSTGKPPESWRDLAAYRTGGTQAAGKVRTPERGLVPGEQKEAMNLTHAVAGGGPGLLRYGRNALGDMPGGVVDVMSNTDPMTGRAIYGAGAAPGAGAEWLGRRTSNIALENAAQGPPKGSQIGDLARFLGTRPAPSYLSGAPALAAAQKKADLRARKAAIRAAAVRKRNAGE